MDADKIPVIGKVRKTMTMMIVNFVLLAIIFVILGIVIPFYPQILDVLVAALLIVAAIIFLNLAYNIYSVRKKYLDWMGD